jgi:translation initiation factor RLI1
VQYQFLQNRAITWKYQRELQEEGRRIIEKSGKSVMVVDHDVYFIDMVSDALIVFDGSPGKRGYAQGPYSLHEGMNRFLKNVDIPSGEMRS